MARGPKRGQRGGDRRIPRTPREIIVRPARTDATTAGAEETRKPLLADTTEEVNRFIADAIGRVTTRYNPNYIATHPRQIVEEATQEISKIPVYLPSTASVHVEIGPHDEAWHLGPPGVFEALINKTDVYVPEDYGWHKGTARGYNQIAQGNPKAYQREMQSTGGNAQRGVGATRRQLDALYNSGKKVIQVDLEKDNPLFRAVDLLLLGKRQGESSRQTVSETKPTDFDAKVSQWLENARNWTTGHKFREVIMLRRLGPAIRETIDTDQRIQQKGQVNVLLRLGDLHSGVYTELKEAATDPSKVTIGSSLGDPVLIPFHELTQTLMHEGVLNPEDVTRFFLRDEFDDLGKKGLSKNLSAQWEQIDYFQQTEILCRVSEQLTTEELTIILT
jgi:hypothetical protein